MKVINVEDLKGTYRQVYCPKGGFVSNRILLESDGMGYTITRTIIPAGLDQLWHYKNHLESCYCVKGEGKLLDIINGDVYDIFPGVTYVLDKNDEHVLKSITEMELICVFNPPLIGQELHKEDGSY